jgi:ABC-type phosphate/phosphonate transport system substrate-binding protein
MPTFSRIGSLIVLAIASSLLMSGCRRTEIIPAPTLPPPTLTPTPFSTPLPTVEPQATYGGDARPYQMIFMPPESRTNDGGDLQTYLNNNSGFTFSVKSVASGAEALTALCGDVPTLALVDGWTLLTAQAQGCGQPLLSYVRGRGATATTGYSSDLIITGESEASGPGGLKGLIFCRLNEEDLQTWILPSLVMRTATDFDPVRDFSSVRNVPTLDALVKEVAEKQCVGAIPGGTMLDYAAAENGTVKVLQSSPELPYGGLVASAGIPVGAADALGELLLKNADELRGLMDADALRAADTNTIQAMLRFLQQAKFDLTNTQ